MKISILEYNHVPIEQAQVELIERKGIGHPDTLADIIAETFSNNYSKYTLGNFGIIANHYVDKVTIIGAKANVDFGKGKIVKKIKIYLFGKVTSKIGNNRINIRKLFQDTVEHIFKNIFKNSDVTKYLSYEINVHDGKGRDHPVSFYTPKSVSDLKRANLVLRSNDSVLCSGYAPYSESEKLVIEMENYLCSGKFKEKFPETGYDVKVMLARDKSGLDITICIPFIAKLTPSREYYSQELAKIKLDLMDKIHQLTRRELTLNINTKDEGGKYAYLTVFGSAIDKGDQGVVGRGNRYNGLITINRE